MAKVEDKAEAAQGLSAERVHELFREILLIRRPREKVEALPRGRAAGFLHVAIGQEAVAAGVCAALEEDDVIADPSRAQPRSPRARM